ncbi:MAG: DNA replication terminus site-binding family protein [Gammaproteobacteria bacterium]|nr:DNA replication terminus site-binding family protein [Gammaproteobacteria bacterium]
MVETELRIEVLEAFSLLTQATISLCDAIKKDSDLIAWVHDSNMTPTLINLHNNPREKACSIFSQLQYTDNQAPREIIVCPGFVGASDHTLKLATSLNECKARFKKSVIALKSDKNTLLTESLSEKMNSILLRCFSTSLTLKTAGLARLHLKQCYRKIPILMHPPQKISWTWAHTRSIKKISLSKAQELLLKKGTDTGIQIQLEKLNKLSENEKLAIVQELAPHLRANIVFSKDNKIQRCMIKGPIPILFPCAIQTPYPQFQPPTQKQGRDQNRSIRSDVKLDPVPYLPAIRAHRYVLSE